MRKSREAKVKIDGTTLRVYRFMLLYNKPIGVRELQRKLKLSSPSVALYHLSKLEKAGLVEKNIEGKYVVKKTIKFGILRDIIIIGRLSFPRFVFYAVILTSLTVSYFSLLFSSFYTEAIILGGIISILSCLIIWKEAIDSLKP